ncbi:MAG: fused MFS/spermidine synthase, partial [Halobacteria archaeon]|nr:fused MFS/spermidine synthase [Halobacteria archaeon]
SKIALFLTSAAAYIAVLILFDELFLQASIVLPIPVRFSALIPVVLLFGPPVYLLGFITPYAAQLSEKESKGEASGQIFAVGTIGSIIGAFGTTFFLIPWLNVEVIKLVFGVLLILGSVIVVGPDISRRIPFKHSVLVLVLLLGAFVGNSYGVTTLGDTVYKTQTPYQNLKVVDDGNVRTLYLDGQPQSAMYLDRPYRHVFDYTRYFHIPLLMTDDVDRVLFIGGGGFTGPKIFAKKYNVTVDVVEIDPEVIRVAKEYFRVNESEKLRIYNMDGRRFLETTEKEYDLIILDAYRKDKVPFHMTTKEFMDLAYDKLDDDGILFANLISAPSGPGSKFYRAEYKTISQVFPRVYSFPTSNTEFVQNIELIATKSPRKITQEELMERNRERDIGIDLSYEIGFYRSNVDTSGVPVLRDGKAPVARLLDPMLGKKYVIEENRTAEGSG